MARLYADPIYGYYQKEKEKQDAAYQNAQPSPQELELMRQQIAAVKQARADRQATIPLVLGQLGMKIVTDKDGKKSIGRLTDDERIALMTQTERSKTEAAQAYQQRAQAAATGTTKLPSFLKKDIDYQKVKEGALLEELLGPEAVNSTAGKQAIEAMRKKEEEVRQRIQEQDLATAPGNAIGLSNQLSAARGQRVKAYESLPNRNASLVASRGSLLQTMQQRRLDEYKKRLAELETKRQRIQALHTLGGTFGGAAAASANQNLGKDMNTSYPTSYGVTYDTSYLGDTSGMGTTYNTDYL